jgi:hypothetical protein
LTSDVRWRQSPTALSRTTVGLVIIDLPSGQLELRGSGSELWKLIETPCTAKDIARHLSPGQTSTVDEVTVDVERLLRQLEAAGAVEPAE